MSELRVETRDTEGGVSVLILDGVLDKRSTAALEQRIREHLDAGKSRLVVNCERLTHMSSDGMSVFLSQLIKIKKAGGDIKFAGMTPEVKNVLSVLGLNKLLTVKASEREAVAEFNQAGFTAQLVPVSQRSAQARPPQSTSVSSPFFCMSLQ